MEDLPYVFFGGDDDDWNKDEEGESTQILQCGNDSTYVRGVFNNKCEWSNKTKTVRDRRNFIF